MKLTWQTWSIISMKEDWKYVNFPSRPSGFYLWKKCSSSRPYLETLLFCDIYNIEVKKRLKLNRYSCINQCYLPVDQIMWFVLAFFCWSYGDSSILDSNHNRNQEDHNREKQWWSKFFLQLLLVSFCGIVTLGRLN